MIWQAFCIQYSDSLYKKAMSIANVNCQCYKKALTMNERILMMKCISSYFQIIQFQIR